MFLIYFFCKWEIVFLWAKFREGHFLGYRVVAVHGRGVERREACPLQTSQLRFSEEVRCELGSYGFWHSSRLLSLWQSVSPVITGIITRKSRDHL